MKTQQLNVRRTFIKMGVSFALGLLALPFKQKKTGEFEVVFENYFGNLTQEEAMSVYHQIYDLEKINKINNRFRKSGKILSYEYSLSQNSDTLCMRFKSVEDFLEWDYALFDNATYSHKKYLESGLTSRSNVPSHLELKGFLTT